MLWERWIPSTYLIKSPVCGVECVFKESEEVQFNYCLVHTKKNKIEFQVKSQTGHLDDVLKVAKKSNAPLLISITGKGIITKKIIFSEHDTLQVKDLVKQHFPTIRTEDFYVQFYKNDSLSGYLSICRKEQVDAILNAIVAKKQDCANVFIGPLICNALSALTSSYNRMPTTIYDVELVNGFIDAIYTKPDTKQGLVLIDTLEVETDYLISFASCFGYLTQQRNYISENAIINQLPIQHTEKNKLRVLMVVLIAIVFIISAVNSVLFFKKYEENAVLETELNLYESKHAQITQLLESYQKKKNLIEQTGIFNNQHLSVYADKIAASVPEEIVLRELCFNPMEEETEEDSLVDFHEKQLIIKGNCNKSLLLNEWINVLKSQDFVKAANLEHFMYNAEGYQPNFVLKIATE